jgi:CHAT domain-containing protein
VGEQATLAALDAAVAAAGPTLDVLHLACHGAFDADDPTRSGLQLAGADAAEAWLGAEAVRERQLGAELVVLSACVSGRTRVYEGDEPSGLVRSFLFAGAAAVLASLWRVDDLSTRLLVQGFYEQLLQPAAMVAGQPPPVRWRKAQALRHAALELRRRPLADWLSRLDAPDAARLSAMAQEAGLSPAQPVFDATFHWAPFMLVGDWG